MTNKYNVQLITDVNGKPMPQYYDEAEGVMKPITKNNGEISGDIDANVTFPETQNVNGTVSVDNLPEIQKVEVTNQKAVQDVSDVQVRDELEQIKQTQSSVLNYLQSYNNLQELQLEELKSLTPDTVEYFTITNPESDSTLFESGPGESLVLDSFEVISDTVNRPEVSLAYYNEFNEIVNISFPTQTPGMSNIRIRPDYMGEEGNGVFEILSYQTGKYNYVTKKPLDFPNGLRIKTFNVGGSCTVKFVVLR